MTSENIQCPAALVNFVPSSSLTLSSSAFCERTASWFSLPPRPSLLGPLFFLYVTQQGRLSIQSYHLAPSGHSPRETGATPWPPPFDVGQASDSTAHVPSAGRIPPRGYPRSTLHSASLILTSALSFFPPKQAPPPESPISKNDTISHPLA